MYGAGEQLADPRSAGVASCVAADATIQLASRGPFLPNAQKLAARPVFVICDAPLHRAPR